METIAQEAKRLLEPIPEENWTTGYRMREDKTCCMLGHWNISHNIDPNISSGSKLFSSTIERFLETKRNCYRPAFDVNDGYVESYQQETPKQRVMALLDDMIAAGY